MAFDWSFSSPKVEETVIVDEDANRVAEQSFASKVEALGYKLDKPIVSIWRDTKVVRVEIYDPRTAKLVGKAIRLERGEHVEEAIEMNGPAE